MAQDTAELTTDQDTDPFWALVARTGSRSPRTCGHRLERLHKFCEKYGVEPQDCMVWEQPHCGEWLDRKRSRAAGAPVAYLGATHSFTSGFHAFCVGISPEAWGRLVAAGANPDWYPDRLRW